MSRFLQLTKKCLCNVDLSKSDKESDKGPAT